MDCKYTASSRFSRQIVHAMQQKHAEFRLDHENRTVAVVLPLQDTCHHGQIIDFQFSVFTRGGQSNLNLQTTKFGRRKKLPLELCQHETFFYLILLVRFKFRIFSKVETDFTWVGKIGFILLINCLEAQNGARPTIC